MDCGQNSVTGKHKKACWSQQNRITKKLTDLEKKTMWRISTEKKTRYSFFFFIQLSNERKKLKNASNCSRVAKSSVCTDDAQSKINVRQCDAEWLVDVLVCFFWFWTCGNIVVMFYCVHLNFPLYIYRWIDNSYNKQSKIHTIQSLCIQ